MLIIPIPAIWHVCKSWHAWLSHLSEKALISQRSSSSSATQVSITTGPVCLAGSCFLGRKALERRPFLWGVWVSGTVNRCISLVSSTLAASSASGRKSASNLWEYQALQEGKWFCGCSTLSECHRVPRPDAWWSRWWWFPCLTSLW